MSKNIVFIGCGEIASGAAQLMQKQSVTVLGVRRTIANLQTGLPAMAANVQQPETLAFLSNSSADTVVYSLAASGFNEASYTDAYIVGLRNTIAALNPDRVKRLIFISSTSVYHQNDGTVVDEKSATHPQKFNGKIMLEAEQLALNTSVGTVLRLSGIYGPGRTRMIDRVRNGLCTPQSNNVITNRIHAADCAGLLAHLLTLDTLPEIVLGSDSGPATAFDVESYIAEQLNIEKRYAAQNESKPKRIAGSKQCSNALILKMGYSLQHPDYRSGYRQLIAGAPSTLR